MERNRRKSLRVSDITRAVDKVTQLRSPRYVKAAEIMIEALTDYHHSSEIEPKAKALAKHLLWAERALTAANQDAYDNQMDFIRVLFGMKPRMRETK